MLPPRRFTQICFIISPSSDLVMSLCHENYYPNYEGETFTTQTTTQASKLINYVTREYEREALQKFVEWKVFKAYENHMLEIFWVCQRVAISMD